MEWLNPYVTAARRTPSPVFASRSGARHGRVIGDDDLETLAARKAIQ